MVLIIITFPLVTTLLFTPQKNYFLFKYLFLPITKLFKTSMKYHM